MILRRVESAQSVGAIVVGCCFYVEAMPGEEHPLLSVVRTAAGAGLEEGIYMVPKAPVCDRKGGQRSASGQHNFIGL